MVWRADRARHLAGGAAPSARSATVDHIGFTPVALVDAFVVVLAIDLGAAAWLVAVVAVAIAVVRDRAKVATERRAARLGSASR